MSTFLRNRATGAVLTTAIVGLTLATAYIHATLGGLLFTLNALGYLGLAGLVVIGAVSPVAVVKRFSWFPRLALIGYTAMTIAGLMNLSLVVVAAAALSGSGPPIDTIEGAHAELGQVRAVGQ